MWTAPDRWTCPVESCANRTVVIDGSPEDTAAAITAVQWRHFREHRDAAALSAKLNKQAPRWGKAS